jgi:UDP-3-O-[3-hydroxymyristoyl] glucosamine N-acyltransferase
MIEILPTVWVSEQATLEGPIIFGRYVRIFGPTRLQPRTVIEDGVTLGHPSPLDMEVAKLQLFDGSTTLSQLDLLDPFVSRGAVIGPDSTVRSGTVIYSGARIGRNFDCAHNVTIRENCQFGDNCYVRVNTEIKREVVIGSNATLGGSIADRSRIANDVTSLGHLMHKYRRLERGGIEMGPVLEDAVFVGREASVVGNIHLGAGCYVGAGTVVAKDVAPGTLVLAMPPRKRPGASPTMEEKIGT